MTVSMKNVRWIHDDVIEKRSWELVCDYSRVEKWNIVAPIPVETIAEVYLGYQISITDEGIFSDPTVLGGIIFEENTIQVNGAIENQEGRYNFTVAHELGHHSLHKKWLYAQRDQQSLFEHAETPSILCREEGLKPRGELQANRFAAALLMPEHLVKEVFKKKYKKRLDVSKNGLKSFIPMSPEYKANRIAEKIIDTGGFTNVSRIAMVNRLLHLKLISGVNFQKNVIEEFAVGEDWVS